MARLQAARVELGIIMQGTLEEVRQHHIDVAKRENAAILSAPPVPNAFERYVDGREGIPEEAVRPAGLIVYTYARMGEIVDYAIEVLRELSPVLSGRYRESHEVFVDGVLAGIDRNFEGAREIVITNVTPYARKIEVGNMKMRVPGSHAVYSQAIGDVRARYGNLARIIFDYRGLVGGALPGFGRERNRSDVRYPSLVITER